MNENFRIKYKVAHFWWAVAFLCIVVLSFQFPVGQKLNIAAAPLIHMVQTPVRWLHDLSLWFDSSSALQQRVLNLQEKVDKQASLRQILATVKAENKQLRRLLKVTQLDGYIWQVVPVVSRSQEEKSRRLMVQASGIHKDDIVVSHEGLVGLVDEVDAEYAVVRTILDASIAVPVTKAGTQMAGLVRGDGEHLLVDFIPRAKAPNVGDLLVASGAGGVFPVGLPVAVVEKVKAVAGGVFVEVIASPVAYWQRDAWLAIASKHHEH
ncbi:rod shape-determining protein MreC [Ghiorsea bivora]|uniref:rod shape-determining protein MreC n=1 Tax=Ghiorsea bivora TaxID=1485545 RepID=UPI00056DD3A2|nr:rod shape-determining protein MreC [Ghiorsea bivora]